MIIVDSNVLIALALRDDAQRQRAKDAVAEISEGIGIPNAVLVETARVLWNVTKDEHFIEAWCREISVGFQLLCEQPQLVQNALGRYAENAARLSLVDCQLIEWHKTLGFDVLSFDDGVNRELNRS